MSLSETTHTTLCHPDSEKTCFYCCPPLRPHGYDPLRKRSILEPMLRRNRERFLRTRESSDILNPAPINGWECWALGYLDEDEKTVGCLLHPSQHHGTDHRYLVGYEGKCAREVCLEAQTFNALSEEAKRFYLAMTIGMDSFAYSSRKENPIFPILLWGRVISDKIAEAEGFRTIHRDEFKARYSAFFTYLDYRIDSYFVEKFVAMRNLACLRESGFFERYKGWQEDLLQRYRSSNTPSQVTPSGTPSDRFVHLHDIPLSFSRLLKFALNIWKAPEERITSLRKQIDGEIERFIESSRSLLV